MDGAGEYYAKQNESEGKKGRKKEREREKGEPRNRLFTIENKLIVTGIGDGAMGAAGDGDEGGHLL